MCSDTKKQIFPFCLVLMTYDYTVFFTEFTLIMLPYLTTFSLSTFSVCVNIAIVIQREQFSWNKQNMRNFPIVYRITVVSQHFSNMILLLPVQLVIFSLCYISDKVFGFGTLQTRFLLQFSIISSPQHHMQRV